MEGRQLNFLEESAILRIVETEHCNYAEAARRLKAREAAPVSKNSEQQAHWREEDGN